MRQWSGDSVLDPQTSVVLESYPHQHVIGVIEAVETEMLVEADGTLVPGVDS